MGVELEPRLFDLRVKRADVARRGKHLMKDGATVGCAIYSRTSARSGKTYGELYTVLLKDGIPITRFRYRSDGKTSMNPPPYGGGHEFVDRFLPCADDEPQAPA